MPTPPASPQSRTEGDEQEGTLAVNMNQRPDYGPAGCCGPAVFAVLTLIVGGLTALGMWIA